MTVYLVSSGQYSDYSIVAIFNSRALAETFVGDSKNYEIEEYPLNPNVENIKATRPWHIVRMDKRGNILKHDESYLDFTLEDRISYIYSSGLPLRKTYFFEAYILATSKEQAVKAANERRAMWIAAGKPWPEDEA